MKKKYYSDLKRLRNLKDEEIDYTDIPELDEAFFEKAVIVLPNPRPACASAWTRRFWTGSKPRAKATRPGSTPARIHEGADKMPAG